MKYCLFCGTCCSSCKNGIFCVKGDNKDSISKKLEYHFLNGAVLADDDIPLSK